MLQRNDGTQFDQNLVRRFPQLLGIYLVGNRQAEYRRDCGGVRARADPYRPEGMGVVRVWRPAAGTPYDVNLWEVEVNEPAVERDSPLNPADYGVDP